MNRTTPLRSDPDKTKQWQQRSRKRLATHSPIRCRKPIRQRKVSKVATVDGDSERAVRDECDDLIRKILRLRDSGCINIDCMKWSRLHPGHYIKRGVLALRWSLDNVWLQCDPHNGAHNEHPKPYREALIDKIGLARVRELERIGRANPRLEYSDLIAIRDGLRIELKRWK